VDILSESLQTECGVKLIKSDQQSLRLAAGSRIQVTNSTNKTSLQMENGEPVQCNFGHVIAMCLRRTADS